MKYTIVQNLSRPQASPIVAAYCASFFCRLRGMMFSRPLPPEKGLVLVYGAIAG